MDSVCDNVLKCYLFPYLNTLDMVLLSGVSKRFHVLLSHVSQEWCNYLPKHRYTYAAARGDLPLLIRLTDIGIYSFDTYNEALYEACRYDELATVIWMITIGRAFTKRVIVNAFSKACKYCHFNMGIEFITRGWISIIDAYTILEYRVETYDTDTYEGYLMVKHVIANS